MKSIKGHSNSFLRFSYYNIRGEKVSTQTDLDGKFILLDIDETKEIEVKCVIHEFK